MTYKGWHISDGGPNYHPVTGRWRAVRYGVGMGHNTEEGLRRMIDMREAACPEWVDLVNGGGVVPIQHCARCGKKREEHS
jgi:hypothetical protein